MRNAHKPASHLSAQCSVDSRPTADTTRLDCVGRGPTVEKQARSSPGCPGCGLRTMSTVCKRKRSLLSPWMSSPLYSEGSGGFMLLSSTHTSHSSCCLPDSGLRSARLTPR